MPRPPRKLQDNGFYHLISRGNNRFALFMIDDGFPAFKEILLKTKEKFDWKIHHYCLMPNHFHLLVCIPDSRELPRIMHSLLLEYSRWYRKRTEYVGYLWQGRYRAFLIEKESYLFACGRYIERNPVRAELAKQAENYLWSSYRYYAFGQKEKLIDEDPSYASFGTTDADRQKKYREFVQIENPYEEWVDRFYLENHFNPAPR